jgi:hypothetical protein
MWAEELDLLPTIPLSSPNPISFLSSSNMKFTFTLLALTATVIAAPIAAPDAAPEAVAEPQGTYATYGMRHCLAH